jgi:hypothetical protein
MNPIKKTRLFIAVAILTLAAVNVCSAQCGAAIKAGIKKLDPYQHNGQVNSCTLVLGEPAQIHLSFYKGLYYKLQVCSEAAVGKVNFRVVDENNAELYNSETAAQGDSFEFFSNSSQELVIELVSADKAKQGCAGIVVGMKVPKASSNNIRNL